MLPLLLSLIVGMSPALEKPVPAAMVLEISGQPMLVRGELAARPLRPTDVLLPGDRITIAEGTVRLAVLDDGHAELIEAGGDIWVAEKGCSPADRVKRQISELNPENLKILRSMAESSRSGVTLVRSARDVEPPEVTPIAGSTVLTERPQLQWPTVLGAKSYEVHLFCREGKDEQLAWKATVSEPSLAYPREKKPLPLGTACTWQVTARMKSGAVVELPRVEFSVAKEGTIRLLETLRTLAQGDAPAGWLLAASSYESCGAYNEALPLYEKLSGRFPNESSLLRTLAAYYTRAGLPGKAEAARKRANRLEHQS